MKDTRTIIKKAVRDMGEAFRLYESGKDTLTLAKRLIRLRRVLAKARSTLLRDRVEAILAKPNLNRKDKETLEELLRSSGY